MKNDPPVLVILTPGFPANEADTACLTSQQNLVRSFNKIAPGLRVILLSFQYPFKGDPYNWHGNRIIPFKGQHKGKLSRLLLWRRVWRQLKTTCRDNHVIGLLSFWCGECTVIGKYFGRRFNLPHYCWILGQDARATNHYVAYIKPPGDQLVALSDFLKEAFHRNHGILPEHVIPNGVEPAAFRAGEPVRSIDLLAVGSLIPLKQFDIFIRLVDQLQKNFSGVKAIICGEGPEREKLQMLILQLGLEKNITLTGELSHGETLELMQQSRILLHPSSYEGFSTVCLEALYAGAKVISFCRPMKAGIRNWWIVDTPGSMLEQAIQLLENNESVGEPVLPYTMDASAAAFLELFNYGPASPAIPALHRLQRKDWH